MTVGVRTSVVLVAPKAFKNVFQKDSVFQKVNQTQTFHSTLLFEPEVRRQGQLVTQCFTANRNSFLAQAVNEKVLEIDIHVTILVGVGQVDTRCMKVSNVEEMVVINRRHNTNNVRNP